MALILPEIKHEYIFKEDTQQQKEATFEQCLDDGKEAAYASIGTDPLDSTYVGAPDILPDHEMEYTSTDQYDYLKTIELVWGYTIGIITTPVVLNADTGDILAEGNAVDSYTAPEGVNIKKGRWIRLSGNRNLHPTILRAVEMPEDVICLKDLCAAIQIDESTGFEIEGFDSSHVINFDNAFQKAYINNEATFDMSSCKTCKYMFNEGLIKYNSGELLTIQNMQPGTNCDYMFYNSYLYKVPEGIRQAGVGGAYMFCDAMLGRKSDLNNNTQGYTGVLAERMFYQTPTSQYIYNSSGNKYTNDYYTGMYNTNVDTTGMVFTSCYPNISCALVGVSGPFPQINFAGVTDMHYLHRQVSGTKTVNTIDLSTIDQSKVLAWWLINFDSAYMDELNIIGNPEGTTLGGGSVPDEFSETSQARLGLSLINFSYRPGHRWYFTDSPGGDLTINITNTLRLYEGSDYYWELDLETDEDGDYVYDSGGIGSTYLISLNNTDHTCNTTLKITGNVQTKYLASNIKINPESNCSVYQSYFSTTEEFERFIDRYSNPGVNLCYGYLFAYQNYDSELTLDDLNLNCFNFDNVFYVDSIVPFFFNQQATNIADLTYDELTINRNNKPCLLTRSYNFCNILNIQNPNIGFIYRRDDEASFSGSNGFATNVTDTSNKTQINITNTDEINIYYHRYENYIDYMYIAGSYSNYVYKLPVLDCPKANIICLSPLRELILKDCLDITIEVPVEECNKTVETEYYFNTFFNSGIGNLMVNSFRNFTSNQCLKYFGIPTTIENFTLEEHSHEDMENIKIYFFPACTWFQYDTFDITQIVDLPNLGIDTSGDYVVVMPNSAPQVQVKNYPLSYLPHTIYLSTFDERYNNQYLPVIYPFYTSDKYSINFDIESIEVVCEEYGQTELQTYCFKPSQLMDIDLSSSTVGTSSWANGYMQYIAYIESGATIHNYYLPTLKQCGFRISTSSSYQFVPIQNTVLTFYHTYSTSSSCRDLTITNTLYNNTEWREHLCPNLETIRFTGAIKNWSLTYNPCNNHVENVLKNIEVDTTYTDSNSHNWLGNIDLRWSQGLTVDALQVLVNARYRSNSTVTINTIPYKLFTAEQISTLSSKVTLTEYIPQEGEL